ncbi:MAG: hypothetical protein V7609_1456 [Verrucomicrobiota bacterium]
MSIRRAEVAAGVIAFSVHFLLVSLVLVICQRDPDPSVIIWWTVFSYADFPVSRIVELLHPSYNIPVAAAFTVFGGLQWAVIAALFVVCLRKLASREASHPKNRR